MSACDVAVDQRSDLHQTIDRIEHLVGPKRADHQRLLFDGGLDRREGKQPAVRVEIPGQATCLSCRVAGRAGILRQISTGDRIECRGLLV